MSRIQTNKTNIVGLLFQRFNPYYRTDGKQVFYTIESAARFLDSVFNLAIIPLVCQHYTRISHKTMDI
ncbi:hypothetical protein VMF7928_03826 [Vibrio marisflavi CECT 7928]|uniref:Uncharacterized protein n=1 Tax=Vibrio marisflavi CECT 7928 TaxID=634439 RepID=A0ABN8ECA6_9VIBR|nr:hypothetical protein VMF7928_03826 [Vibrio marisflavi CECT 7928]